jgi:hypothetical protein
MSKIMNLADRTLTDIEIEMEPAHRTGIYEKSLSTTSGGGISRVTGSCRYLCVFHDGGANQGSVVVMIDTSSEFRFERVDKSTMRVTCTGPYSEQLVQLPLVGDERSITIGKGRLVIIRRRLPAADAKSDLFRRANS